MYDGWFNRSDHATQFDFKNISESYLLGWTWCLGLTLHHYILNMIIKVMIYIVITFITKNKVDELLLRKM